MTDWNKITMQWMNNFMDIGVLVTDTKLNISSWNWWMKNHTGRKAEDMIGQPLLEVYPDIITRGKDKYYHQALSDQAVVLSHRFHNYLIPMKNSIDTSATEYMHQSVKIAPLKEYGQLIGTITILTDVSERLVYEAELKESEEKNRLLIQKAHDYLNNIIKSMPSVIVGIDTEERVTHWNLEAENLTGIDAKQAQGQPLKNVFPQSSKLIKDIRQIIQKKIPQKAEKLAREVDGKICYSDLMVYPLITNSIEGAVLRMDDITSRVRLEEMMIQNEKMMSIGGLAAGMAHEINNPLSGVLQGIQNILRRISPELKKNLKTAQDCGIDLETIRTYLEKRDILNYLTGVKECGERAAKIIDNMLRFSRSTESKMLSSNITDIIDQTIELASTDYDLTKQYDFRNIKIHRDFDPNLPEVPCVSTEIQQVILNLLRNAAQELCAQKDRTEPAQIILRTLKNNNMAKIEVEDNGPGMDENIRKRIFEPFFTTKETGTGTGLGLSVSYFIITRNHQGTIRVESKKGKGTKFIINLPLK
ncbi:two-component system, NtrC family, sensor kinase [Candidatus Magnetomoraceae bacterium gMMP-15]